MHLVFSIGYYAHIVNNLFLQYNVNNHILDGVHYLWWPGVLPDGESIGVCTESRIC